MKKWLRRALVAAALIGLTYAILCEMSTHTVRGWWNGEATFQGRPTSFWRSRIENWVERFETRDDAEKYMWAHSFRGMISSTAIIYSPPRPTLWTKIRRSLGQAVADDCDPPEVFKGFAPAEDVEPVLRELQGEPNLERFIQIARREKFFW